MKTYDELVKLAGKAAGARYFEQMQTQSQTLRDLDVTMTVKVLSAAFAVHEVVVEDDILWCREVEYERLLRDDARSRTMVGYLERATKKVNS